MRALADKVLGKLHFTLEQVQDLTPTPMTLSSVMFYTEENPYTAEPLFVARSQEDKRRQKSYFFGGTLPTDHRHEATSRDTKRGGNRTTKAEGRTAKPEHRCTRPEGRKPQRGTTSRGTKRRTNNTNR